MRRDRASTFLVKGCVSNSVMFRLDETLTLRIWICFSRSSLQWNNCWGLLRPEVKWSRLDSKVFTSSIILLYASDNSNRLIIISRISCHCFNRPKWIKKCYNNLKYICKFYQLKKIFLNRIILRQFFEIQIFWVVTKLSLIFQ